MVKSRRSIRVGIVVLLAGTLLAGWQSAQGGEQETPVAAPFQRGIVVVGDSITARYDDVEGGAAQGWWSLVGDHFGAPVTTYAQSGSGFLRPGYGRAGRVCTGNRFIDRPDAYRGTAPSLLIVEGGRNDWATCRDGGLVTSTDQEVADAVTRYFRVLRANLPDTTRIVVLGPPWGPVDPWEQRRITSIVHTAAQRQNLEYLSTTGTIDRSSRVVDGVHPNRAGSVALARRVITALS